MQSNTQKRLKTNVLNTIEFEIYSNMIETDVLWKTSDVDWNSRHLENGMQGINKTGIHLEWQNNCQMRKRTKEDGMKLAKKSKGERKYPIISF